MSAVGVSGSTVPFHRTGAGSIPSTALQQLVIKPVPFSVAKELLVSKHYLHSWPGATRLAFGAFLGSRLLGALTLGAGPTNAYALVEGATPEWCLALTRLWLSDELPRSSESRFLSIVLRALKRNTHLKFLVTYADPAQGHVGTIYQATNWVYTGLSQATPRYDTGDGVPRHSRSVSQLLGSRQQTYLQQIGLTVHRVPQQPKHRYVYFLDPEWERLLKVPALPYPKREVSHAAC